MRRTLWTRPKPPGATWEKKAARTIERDEFIQLLDGKTEEEVFGREEPVLPAPPAPPEAPERKPERAPKPLPRPGLAGGTAEMRGASPEKPSP